MLAIKIGNVRYSLSHISSVTEVHSDNLYRNYNDTGWMEIDEYPPQDKEKHSGLIVKAYYDGTQAYDILYMSDAEEFLELYDRYMNTIEN